MSDECVSSEHDKQIQMKEEMSEKKEENGVPPETSLTKQNSTKKQETGNGQNLTNQLASMAAAESSSNGVGPPPPLKKLQSEELFNMMIVNALPSTSVLTFESGDSTDPIISSEELAELRDADRQMEMEAEALLGGQNDMVFIMKYFCLF
jgi:hypothetical protein